MEFYLSKDLVVDEDVGERGKSNCGEALKLHYDIIRYKNRMVLISFNDSGLVHYDSSENL